MHRGRPFRAAAAQRRSNLYNVIALLGFQLLQMDRKPPVTLGLLAANLLAFWRPEGLSGIPANSEGCLQPYLVLQRRQWWRVLWSPFLHADEAHLYYNMASLLWKGAQLEPEMGSLPFAGLVTELLLVSNGIMAAASLGLATASRNLAGIYYRQCAVGFSGVLFGLKVVLSSQSSSWTSIAGIPLPVKYMCWAELLYIQLMTPNASFLGHLSGILAGLLHVAVVRPLLRGRRPRLPFRVPRLTWRPWSGRPRFAAGTPSQPRDGGDGAEQQRTYDEGYDRAWRGGSSVGPGRQRPAPRSPPHR